MVESKIGENSSNNRLSACIGCSGNVEITDLFGNSSLKPGGWLDVAEYECRLKSDDGTLPVDGDLIRYYDLVNEAADKLGRYLRHCQPLALI